VIASMGSKSTHWQAILPFLLVNFFNLALSFNIDTKSLVVQQGPKASCDDCMFGFSVAQHKEGGVPWLLIGAPEADARQPGVHKGGAVYKCSAEVPGDCTIIPFDTKGSTPTPTGQPYDSKSGQWLGSVVTSSGEDGTVLVKTGLLNFLFLTGSDFLKLFFSGMCTTLYLLRIYESSRSCWSLSYCKQKLYRISKISALR